MNPPINRPHAPDAARDPILFYDGVCNLCNRSVRWVIRHDRNAVFRFASLQSRAAADRLGAPDSARRDSDTVVLLEDGRAHFKSDAWLRTFRRLGAPWSWISVCGRLLPRSIRDGLYDFVAARRYRWFGRTETCPLPDPSVRSRFLD